ncbi:MAG: SRPBCC family protein [Actinomycetota bacterium]|jgi:uncharacterized membrane protein|nr:SRPBCC family protein [Actinomycetota bacterium]
MSTVQQSIEVNVPIRTAYDQWTQFEEFPKFMEGVEEVRQVTDTRTHWVTKIAGMDREFDAEITEQVPDKRIAWRAVDGPDQGGVVMFEPVDSGTTRVTVEMDFAPEGLAEKAGDALGVVDRRVKGDLERFKDFIEGRGVETGAWRGEV